jgi:hypothetical protein
MRIIMLITLVIVFAVILAARRRGPRVTQIDRTVSQRPTEGDER